MSRYGIRDILDITISDYTTKKPVLYLTSGKSSNLESASETAYARGGKGNPKLVAFDSSRDETIMFEDALVSPESLGLMFGATPTTGAFETWKTEVLTVSATNTITLSKTPAETAGTDKFFFITTDGSSLGAEQTYNASKGSNQYDISGTTVTFNATSCPENTLIIAKYKYTTAATTRKVEIKADTFPGTYEIVGECFFRLESGVDVPATFYIHKGKVMPNNTIALSASGDPSVFSFTVDCLKAIGATNMVDIYIHES